MHDSPFDDPDVPTHRQTVSPGDDLMVAGEVPDGLSRIVDGSFEVVVADTRRRVRTAVLGPGDIVGEISLFAGGHATATVTATSAGSVVTIDRDDARRWLDHHPGTAERLATEGRTRVDHNHLVLLLADLLDTEDPEVVGDAAARCRPVRRSAGEVLFSQGDPADAAWIVATGRLGVHRDDADGRHDLRRLGRGEIVGETGLFERSPRSATVMALRDSVLVEITAEAFESLLARHPGLMLRVGRQVLERMVRPVRARRSVAVIAVVVATHGADDVPRGMATVLGDQASVAFVDAEVAAAELGAGTPGLGPDDVGAPRLVEWLHEVEVAHEVTVVGVLPDDPPAWRRRATTLADRVVVVTQPDPDWDAVDRAMEAVPDRTTTLLGVWHPAGTDRPRHSAALLARAGADDILHLRADHDGDLGRAARLAAGRGVGLVLGGGGARGLAHLGVYRALVEAGVPIDTVVGASIGATLGGVISLGLGPDEAIDGAITGFKDVLDYTIPVVSLIKAERITTAIEQRYGGWDFEDTWIPFRCVSTNLTHSRTEVHRSGPLPHAIRASLAIPGVMPPVPSGDDLLVDGGVLDNLPVDVLAAEGRVGTIIAVDVAPPLGPIAREDFGLSVSGWTALRAGLGRRRSNYPKLSAVLMRSMLVGSIGRRQEVIDTAQVDLLLELDLRGVSLLDFSQVAEVAARGYDAALPEIEAWVASTGRR